MRRLIAAFTLVLVGLSIEAAAQNPPCTTPSPQTTPPTYMCAAGFPRAATFDYNSGVLPGDVFRLYVGTSQVGPDVPATAGVNIQVQFGSTLPAGTYDVAVSIVRPAALVSEMKSAPVRLIIVPPNAATPSNLRIVEVIMRGLDVAGNVLWEHTASMQVQ